MLNKIIFILSHKIFLILAGLLLVAGMAVIFVAVKPVAHVATFTSSGLSTATSASIANRPGTTGYTLTIENADASLQTIDTDLQKVFDYSYPKLVSAFALNPNAVPKNVTLKYDSTYNGFAETYGSQALIVANPYEVKLDPDGHGWLTHELTHVVQDYPVTCGSGGWITESLADYARWVDAPPGASFANWYQGAPSPTDNYTKGYGTGARFFLWIQQYYSSTIVSKVNRACQTAQSPEAVFQTVTGKTLDQLWAAYAADTNFNPPRN